MHYPDGDYDLIEVKDALSKDFQSERELCDYVEDNIILFVKDILGLEYEKHAREFPLATTKKRYRGSKRIDFYIITKCGQRIGVECKDPRNGNELAAAVGQCLSYITLFELNEKPIDRMVILSTKIDSCLPLILNKFNLPLDFICMDKSKHLTYKKR